MQAHGLKRYLVLLFEQKNVLTTYDILCFINYGISVSENQTLESLIKLNIIQALKNYNLEYTEIKYGNPFALEYEYIKD